MTAEFVTVRGGARIALESFTSPINGRRHAPRSRPMLLCALMARGHNLG